MWLRNRVRFTLATVMMLVVTSAAASALFAKVREHAAVATKPYLKIDAPVLFVLSIVLTAVALGSMKGHSAVQTMLQVTVACLGYLSLIWLAEAMLERPLLYWFQVGFGVLVAAPMWARNVVKTEMDRGPRRDWWKKTFEAVIFAFLTMNLVLLGILIQFMAFLVGTQLPGLP
jgi:hypothetical protein